MNRKIVCLRNPCQIPGYLRWLFVAELFCVLKSRNLTFQDLCIFYNIFAIVGDNFSLNRMKNDKVVRKTNMSKIIHKKRLVQNCKQLLVMVPPKPDSQCSVGGSKLLVRHHIIGESARKTHPTAGPPRSPWCCIGRHRRWQDPDIPGNLSLTPNLKQEIQIQIIKANAARM